MSLGEEDGEIVPVAKEVRAHVPVGNTIGENVPMCEMRRLKKA